MVLSTDFITQVMLQLQVLGLKCWPGGIDTSTPLERPQGIYDLALGIPVGQPDLAYVGGISLWRSGPFQQAEQAAIPIDIPGFPYGVHADIQDIVVAPSGTMYVTTDGGIYKSTDGGSSYTSVTIILTLRNSTEWLIVQDQQ